MKILHTADWHLGQKFLYKDRQEEHQLALNWIAEQITTQQIDVLILAGDVFDIQNPPNYARSMYYNFLVNLIKTNCRHVIVIGGNHDSPAMLDAPKQLLETLNVHVVGSASENLADEIIELKNSKNELEMVVAAVPFLRDQDIRRSVIEETNLERIERIKKGIYNHYEAVGKLVKPYQKKQVPIVATGHLYAKGATASADDQNNIYIGNRENISADQFPVVFDYVALGHIHRAQYLGDQEHVRYSGSIIPLRFKETKDDKSISIIEFDKKNIKSIETIDIPTFRRLKTIEGDLEKIEASLTRFSKKDTRNLRPWVEIILTGDQIIPDADRHIREFAKEMELDILKIRVQRKRSTVQATQQLLALEDLTPLEIFEKKCADYTDDKTMLTELKSTYLELQDWINDQDQL